MLAIVAIALFYFNFPVQEKNEEMEFGITFSYRYAGEIGLDWQETYLAILDDLGVKKMRIPIYWDSVEEQKDQYSWEKIDWQLDEAAKRDVEVILVLGQKVPRWPECFIPEWVQNTEEKNKELLEIISQSVKRYKNRPAVEYWQVENEPFLAFGICPTLDKELLKKEIELVHILDPSREVIVTDSGELSLWIQSAKLADVFGTTMYREVVSNKFGVRWKYPIGPRFFHFKRWLIETFAKQEEAIVVELQAEPWIEGWTTSAPLSDQFSSMDENKLKDNIEFVKKTGFDEAYLWGGEWWYWLKTKKDYPALWETAKMIFSND